MRNIRLSLIDLPAAARDVTFAAAQEAFPGAEVVETVTLEEAMRSEQRHGLELLVLGDTNPASIIQATQAVNETGLLRWAVVILGRDTSELAETIPPEEWNPWLLARVFRSALLQYELLRENLRMRGDLKTIARRFSHDLVTPVGCINTSACVLRILPAEETQSIASIIQNIEDSSGEISHLIERVSFVVRASADPSIPSEVEMGAVFTAVLNQLETDIEKAGATVMTPPSWPKLTGVSKWLDVIWRNLLGNAIRHGGPSAQIQIAWQREGEDCRFVVSDSGAGVSPAMQSGLFRPFDQLHALHTTGLGLSIVQRLTVLQGGTCGYENRPEGGGHFYFTVPAAKA